MKFIQNVYNLMIYIVYATAVIYLQNRRRFLTEIRENEEVV